MRIRLVGAFFSSTIPLISVAVFLFWLVVSAQVRPMYYQLVLQNHVDGLSQSRWKFTPPAVLGRQPDSQVCIEHESISRKHCQFSFNGEGALVVKDLESMNGTYVDEIRIQQTALMPGQIIQIGALRLQIQFSGEADDGPTAATAAKGNVYTTRPMESFRPVPLPPEKSWWQRWFGGS